MSDKKWIIDENIECDNCGGTCKVLSKSNEEGMYHDGEKVKCTECGNEGQTHIVNDNKILITFD